MGTRVERVPTNFLIMAYDPTLPANNSPLSSAELRNQMTALKALIDQRPTTNEALDLIIDNSPAPAGGVAPLGLVASNPPTAAQLQQVIDKLNGLISALQRP